MKKLIWDTIDINNLVYSLNHLNHCNSVLQSYKTGEEPKAYIEDQKYAAENFKSELIELVEKIVDNRLNVTNK